MNEVFEMANKSLKAYCCLMWKGFKIGNHHKKIIAKLEAVERGEIKRLMIFMPPRHSKSLTASVMFPSWYIGRNPDKYVIFTSYSQEVATDFGRKVRNQCDDEYHKQTFPGIEVADDSSSSRRFGTNQGGIYYAVGAMGPLTSRGAHIAILDDLIKNREDANSEILRKKLQDWYTSTLYTRLMPNAAIVLIQTRWHEDDLPGWILGQEEQWDVLSLPAINESGEALWPEQYPIQEILNIKRAIGSRDFEALYQQHPTPLEGGMIKRSWLRFYTQLPAKFDNLILSWDMTFKESETSDYVVGQCWGRCGGEFFLIDQIRDRMDFPTTMKQFQLFCLKHPEATAKLIEAKANGQAIIDSLKSKVSGIIPVIPKESKEARLSSIAPCFEAGNVYLPETKWIGDYIEELVSFPNAKQDDCVDASSQALSYLFKKSVARPNIMTVGRYA